MHLVLCNSICSPIPSLKTTAVISLLFAPQLSWMCGRSMSIITSTTLPINCLVLLQISIQLVCLHLKFSQWFVQSQKPSTPPPSLIYLKPSAIQGCTICPLQQKSGRSRRHLWLPSVLVRLHQHQHLTHPWPESSTFRILSLTSFQYIQNNWMVSSIFIH